MDICTKFAGISESWNSTTCPSGTSGTFRTFRTGGAGTDGRTTRPFEDSGFY
ncbi:hypothetical protein BDR03DRAFT_975269, partial [Suillus americanus]